MNRESSIKVLEEQSPWDIVIIGGGATGLGVALDSALRGYKTLLLEQADFTKGTSSRSTKLVHGGVRYLAQGNIKLVLEALYERGLLLKNAPHLTGNQAFVIPAYGLGKGLFYTAGLKLYDLMAGRLSLGKSELVGARKVVKMLPTIHTKGLTNGVVYHDGQFDDARLGINLAQSCTESGGHVLNYMRVTGLGKDVKGEIDKVLVTDEENGKTFELKSKVVVNATGVFVDQILAMDNPEKPAMVQPSQGTHIVLEQSFLPGNHALMIPETPDGRVLFAVPWHGKVLVGTTDTLVENAELEPRSREEEVDFILETFSRYISKKATRKDVLSVFSGLRPLARPEKEGKKTREISRNHKVIVSESNLITITGGKWTTYRKMAEDTVDTAIRIGGLPQIKSTTSGFKIHGYQIPEADSGWFSVYGSDGDKIQEIVKADPLMGMKLHAAYPYIKAEVVWAVRHEMARTVEDFLARRIRILFLDAYAAMAMAPVVAELMAKELHNTGQWAEEQIVAFKKLAQHYLL